MVTLIRSTSPRTLLYRKATQVQGSPTHHSHSRIEEKVYSLVVDSLCREVDRRAELELGQERKTFHLGRVQSGEVVHWCGGNEQTIVLMGGSDETTHDAYI